MSGSVELSGDEIVGALRDLQSAINDLGPAFREIGEVLTESTKARFESGIGPDGQPWQDNADATIERKGRNSPLIDTGTLMEQIHYSIVGNTLEIGSPMVYAAMQQFGGTKDEFPWLWGDIPARPFLGVSASDRDDILQIVKSHLSSSI